MIRHIAQRLLLSIPELIGVLLLGFLLLQVIPTDPAIVLAGPSATPDIVAAIRQDLGRRAAISPCGGSALPA
jgi:glutathione transport system permease protein